MTQNEIEKKINNIEKIVDKMSDNYDRTLNEIMVEQERQRTIKSLDKSDEMDFEREDKVKNLDVVRFISKLLCVGLVIGILLGVICEVLKTFIPTV